MQPQSLSFSERGTVSVLAQADIQEARICSTIAAQTQTITTPKMKTTTIVSSIVAALALAAMAATALNPTHRRNKVVVRKGTDAFTCISVRRGLDSNILANRLEAHDHADTCVKLDLLSGLTANITKRSHAAVARNGLTPTRRREQMTTKLGKVFPAELGTR